MKEDMEKEIKLNGKRKWRLENVNTEHNKISDDVTGFRDQFQTDFLQTRWRLESENKTYIH